MAKIPLKIQMVVGGGVDNLSVECRHKQSEIYWGGVYLFGYAFFGYYSIFFIVSASPQFYPFPQDSFSIHSGQAHNTDSHSNQTSLRKRRQQILQFINQNKGKMADSYLCLLCNKSVTDNSNMNKHLEFKHNDELKEFLANLS